jgi:threonyl-tRNA synthetase
MRVRGFVQDDGHIFCTEDQIESEVTAFNALARRSMPTSASTMSPSSWRCVRTKRVGSDEVWDKAEDALRQGLRASGLEWDELPGEGAFYGPKIEFHIKDSIGRGLAVRHHAGRLLDAGPPRRRIRRRATTSARCRSCCTGPSSVRWSASSAS